MSRAFIWKQDPSVTAVGIRLTYVPEKIQDGPKDNMIQIRGMTVVKGDKNRDFLFDPSKNDVEFDAVHTFVVVRQVVTMYQRALKRLNNNKRRGETKPLTWQWGSTTPIQVMPHAGTDKNAYYSRNERALKFFYFEHDGSMVYTNRSYDVVAHEVGHAILDGLRPGYFASWHPQTGGLHEAFGDITAILTMLSQLDQCEAIIAHSKADLHAKTFFNAVAEQFGEALYGHRQGLRNADNNLTLSQVSEEVHDISQVFTGAFYDILADIFDDMRNPLLHDDAQVLFQVGEHMCNVLLESLLRGPAKNATYADIANKMIAVETNSKWKKIIRHQFEVRQVLGKRAVKPIKKTVEMQWKKCCSTMSSKEHLDAVEEAIRQKQSCFFFSSKAKV